MTHRKTTQVGVVGLGYVGLPLAIEILNSGYEVIGVDISKERVQQLRDGGSYVRDISDKTISDALETGFTPTTEYEDLSSVESVSICVPTPLRKSGQPDISHVIDASEELARIMPKKATVILESTVYPGATEEVVADKFIENDLNIGEDIFVAFSPERIDPGNENYSIQNIPKVIGGVTESCGNHAVSIYEPVFERTVRVSGSREAEFVKLLENTFRSVNIGLINEIALTADQMNVDIWNVINAAATKPFGYMPFYPGPGLGGHCIPIDPQHLSWKAKQQGLETRFIDLADRINRQMPEHVVNRTATLLNKNGRAVLNANILIIGVAYKPDVSDTRESPALDIIESLRSRGANIQYHDPHVPRIQTEEWQYSSQQLTEMLLKNQDCVVIVTNHSKINVQKIIEYSSIVFDTRNATAGLDDVNHVHRL